MAKITDERVREMLLGRRAVRLYNVPGLEVPVGMRLLADHEIDSARLAAQRHIANLCLKRSLDPEKVLGADPELLDREIERQIVWRAAIDPDTATRPEPEQFFPSDDDVRRVDAALVRALFDAYLDHQEYISPRVTLSAEEVDRVIAEAGKGQLSLALRHCAPDTLRLFVLSLASRLHDTSRSSS